MQWENVNSWNRHFQTTQTHHPNSFPCKYSPIFGFWCLGAKSPYAFYYIIEGAFQLKQWSGTFQFPWFKFWKMSRFFFSKLQIFLSGGYVQYKWLFIESAHIQLTCIGIRNGIIIIIHKNDFHMSRCNVDEKDERKNIFRSPLFF